MNENKRDRNIAIILAFVTSLLVFTTIIIIALPLKNYSPLTGYISFLGSSASRLRTVINSCFAIAGVCTIILSFILYKSLLISENYKMGQAFLAISGFLLILLGVFPTDPHGEGTVSGRLHQMVGNLVYIMIPIAAIFLGMGFKKQDEWKRFSNISFLLASVTLIAATFVKFFSFYRGLLERIGIAADLFWMALIAFALYEKYSKKML